MQTISVSEAINKLYTEGLQTAKELGIDIKKDDFQIVQHLDDGNAVFLSVEGEGDEREFKINVTDSMVVLPKIDGVLDVYKEEN